MNFSFVVFFALAVMFCILIVLVLSYDNENWLNYEKTCAPLPVVVIHPTNKGRIFLSCLKEDGTLKVVEHKMENK